MDSNKILGATLVNTIGQIVGVVDGICWQKGHKCVLKCGEEYFCADALSTKKKRIVGKNLQKTTALATLDSHKQVFDTVGKLLGKLTATIITRTLKLKSITIDNGKEYTLANMVANGDILLVKNNTHGKKKTTNKKTKTTALTTQNCMVNTEFVAIMPKRKYGNFSFLLGKRVDKNIQNFLGEIIVHKGEIITQKIYLTAKRFGKLTELCLHAE